MEDVRFGVEGRGWDLRRGDTCRDACPEFSQALEFGQFEPTSQFSYGIASFLIELLDLALSRNLDRFGNLPECSTCLHGGNKKPPQILTSRSQLVLG